MLFAMRVRGILADGSEVLAELDTKLAAIRIHQGNVSSPLVMDFVRTELAAYGDGQSIEWQAPDLVPLDV